MLATTDHKVVGYLYLTTSFAFFLAAGAMAMLMRAELARPGMQVVGREMYNELVTIHGTVMLLLFATPLFAGFANVLVPLQIGAPDVAFPRLNTLSYYLFAFGGLMVLSGFAAPGGAAAFGWTGYTPLSTVVRSYVGMIGAIIAIAGLSMTVWAHHMFATGQVLLPFFSFMSFLIAIPTGIKFFNWIGAMWRGQIVVKTPMLFAIGFLVTFLFGGLTGVILASPALDFHVTDSYFVVAHMHYVLFGTVVFAMFGGFYFWWPKMTGKMLSEGWGKLHFWTLFIGFHTTFLVQHLLGAEGMQRRIADYPARFGALNLLSSIGAFTLGASTLAFLWNVWQSHRQPAPGPVGCGTSPASSVAERAVTDPSDRCAEARPDMVPHR